jgi:hypothetical protein
MIDRWATHVGIFAREHEQYHIVVIVEVETEPLRGVIFAEGDDIDLPIPDAIEMAPRFEDCLEHDRGNRRFIHDEVIAPSRGNRGVISHTPI